MGTFFHRHRGATPYLLLAPGVLWLAIFFLIPLGFLGYQSLQSGFFPNFEFTWQFSNFSDGIRDYHEQFIRSFLYAGIATVACLVLAESYAGQGRNGEDDAGDSGVVDCGVRSFKNVRRNNAAFIAGDRR